MFLKLCGAEGETFGIARKFPRAEGVSKALHPAKSFEGIIITERTVAGKGVLVKIKNCAEIPARFDPDQFIDLFPACTPFQPDAVEINCDDPRSSLIGSQSNRQIVVISAVEVAGTVDLIRGETGKQAAEAISQR